MPKEIAEKIKKLLRLARSSNRAEAELAMQRAFEQAQKHHLSIEELELEKDLEAVARTAFSVGARISTEHKLACGILEDYFNVRCVLNRPRILIFGTDTDIAIAEYVLDFLVGQIRRGLSEYKRSEALQRRKLTANKRLSYVRGFIYAIHSKLSDTKASLPERSETAIVVQKSRLDKAVEQQCPGITQSRIAEPKRTQHGAMQSGWDHGQKTQINAPIAGAARAAIA